MITFQTEKEPKIQLFDFRAFQIKMQMPSHEKILLQILFEAFPITSRSTIQRHKTHFKNSFKANATNSNDKSSNSWIPGS